MKRSTALFAALILGSCVALSQLPGGASIPGLGNIQELAQKLHLNPQQISQLQPILQNEVSKILGIKNNPTLSGEEKVKQAQAVESQTDPQVKSILDPSQYKQWQSIRLDQFKQLKDALLH